jgi:uncharacterized protein (TIGR04255 family)
MKIPRKITPDNIKDSLVQIVFNPACPPELVIGRFENHLKNLLEFKGGTPPLKQVFRLPDENELNFGQFQTGVFQGGFFLDKKEFVQVTVSANAIVFNTFKNYPGWEVMLSVIEETVKVLFEKGIAESVQRIGVRYISQFDGIAIFEKLKMSLGLNISNKNYTTTQIRSEYDEDEFKIILNLLNNFQRSENDIQRNFSTIDIDVIKFYESVTDVREIIGDVDKAHFKQKSTFFSLLSDEFLKSLNPEY